MPYKPITHSIGDPFAIPYYCKKCKFAEVHGESGTCHFREDGKFKPDVAFSCFRMIIPETRHDKNE